MSFSCWTNFTQFKKDFGINHFFIFIFLSLWHITEALLDIQLYIYIFNRYRHKGGIICPLFPYFGDA